MEKKDSPLVWDSLAMEWRERRTEHQRVAAAIDETLRARRARKDVTIHPVDGVPNAFSVGFRYELPIDEVDGVRFADYRDPGYYDRLMAFGPPNPFDRATICADKNCPDYEPTQFHVHISPNMLMVEDGDARRGHFGCDGNYRLYDQITNGNPPTSPTPEEIRRDIENFIKHSYPEAMDYVWTSAIDPTPRHRPKMTEISERDSEGYANVLHHTMRMQGSLPGVVDGERIDDARMRFLASADATMLIADGRRFRLLHEIMYWHSAGDELAAEVFACFEENEKLRFDDKGIETLDEMRASMDRLKWYADKLNWHDHLVKLQAK